MPFEQILAGYGHKIIFSKYNVFLEYNDFFYSHVNLKLMLTNIKSDILGVEQSNPDFLIVITGNLYLIM